MPNITKECPYCGEQPKKTCSNKKWTFEHFCLGYVAVATGDDLETANAKWNQAVDSFLVEMEQQRWF